jgi:hypothetical protein
MRAALLAISTTLAACSGAHGPIALVEGYCPNNEADRCYFASAPNDGF